MCYAPGKPQARLWIRLIRPKRGAMISSRVVQVIFCADTEELLIHELFSRHQLNKSINTSQASLTTRNKSTVSDESLSG